MITLVLLNEKKKGNHYNTPHPKKKKTLTMIASLFKMVSPHECKIENKGYAVKNVTYDTLIIIVSMIYLTL